MSTIKLCAIVAMSENRVIGRDNKLIWHIPEDLKHFKNTTMGCPLIMGRKSFDSLPGILPGRPHIVISRRNNANQMDTPRVKYVDSTQRALKLAHKIAREQKAKNIFVAGGGEIYKQILVDIDRLYLTVIHKNYEGDTTFPKLNWEHWTITNTQDHEAEAINDDETRPAFTIMTLDRKH